MIHLRLLRRSVIGGLGCAVAILGIIAGVQVADFYRSAPPSRYSVSGAISTPDGSLWLVKTDDSRLSRSILLQPLPLSWASAIVDEVPESDLMNKCWQLQVRERGPGIYAGIVAKAPLLYFIKLDRIPRNGVDEKFSFFWSGLVINLLIINFPIAAILYFLQLLYMRHVRRSDLCLNCGYSIEGVVRCPECGRMCINIDGIDQ